MMKKPLDEETYLRTHTAIDLAKVRGLDPAELLHTRGLLASPQLIKHTKVQAMKQMHQDLASWRPAEVLRMKYPENRQCTPQDMYNCILEYLQRLIDVAKEE